jgi:mannosyl-3-phosphoglycerate phosphatase
VASHLIFTDLDGTLLDHDTYSYEEARPALNRLRELAIPLMIVTSKTRAEVARLRTELALPGEDITENGAESRGYAWLCQQLESLSAETGVPVRGFHQMTPEEISRAAGLSLEVARLASQREQAEPFQILDEGGSSRLLAAIESRGLRWTRGGRFHHLFERGGKGDAVRKVLARNPGVRTLGLGDAPNDIEFLRAVDTAIIVRSPRADAVAAELPGASITPVPGPAGWNQAVLQWTSSPAQSAYRP